MFPILLGCIIVPLHEISFGLQEELDNILQETDACPEYWAEMIEDLTNSGELQHEDFQMYRDQPQRFVDPNPEQLGKDNLYLLFVWV
jgi:hypothetical protein